MKLFKSKVGEKSKATTITPNTNPFLEEEEEGNEDDDDDDKDKPFFMPQTVFDTLKKTNKVLDDVNGLVGQVKDNSVYRLLFGDNKSISPLIQLLLFDMGELLLEKGKAWKRWLKLVVKLAIAVGLGSKIISFLESKYDEVMRARECRLGRITSQALEGSVVTVLSGLLFVCMMFAMNRGSKVGQKVKEKDYQTLWDLCAAKGRDIGNIDRGMSGVLNIIKRFEEAMLQVYEKFDDGDPLSQKSKVKLYTELADKIVIILKDLNSMEKYNALFTDKQSRSQVKTLISYHTQYLEVLSDPVLSRQFSSTTTMINVMVNKLRTRIENTFDSAAVRIDPCHISICGDPGLGKSYASNCLASIIGKSQKVADEDLCYSRTPNSDFWDNYHGQEFVCLDDVDSTSDAEKANELITSKSNVPKVLPMAHLEQKGMYFLSRGIISTTNTPYPNIEGIRCTEAYWRRRDVLINARWKGAQIKRADLSHMIFDVWNPIDPSAKPIKTDLSFKDLCHYLIPLYSMHLKKQNELVYSVQPKSNLKEVYLYDACEEQHKSIIDKLYNIHLLQVVKSANARVRDPTEIFAQSGSEFLSPKDYFKKIRSIFFSDLKDSAKTFLALAAIIGGSYILYKTMRKKNKNDKERKRQDYLLNGFVDTEAGSVVPIQSMKHKDLPRDGERYEHYHFCERCNKLFSHTHAWLDPEIAKVCHNLCSICKKKNRDAENARAQKGKVAEMVFDHEDAERVLAEANVVSGGNMHTRFLKQRKFNSAEEFKKTVLATKEVESQACSDPFFFQFEDMIRKNMGRIKVGNASVGFIGLKERWIVCPRHIFLQMQGNSFPVLIEYDNMKHCIELNTKDFKRPISESNTMEPDCLFINLIGNPSIRQFKNICDHFVSIKELHKAMRDSGVLLTNSDGNGRHVLRTIEEGATKKSVTPFGNIFLVPASLGYEAVTRRGDCGGPLITLNTHVKGKVLGFHVGAYTDRNVGFAYPLTSEVIKKTIGERDKGVVLDLTEIESQCDIVYADNSEAWDDQELVCVPEGNIKIVGRLKKEFSVPLPMDTKITPSPIFDEIWPHISEPAILSNRDPRVKTNVYQSGVNKFGNKIINRSRANYLTVRRWWIKKLIKEFEKYPLKVRELTYDEVINGIDGCDVLTPLRMDTSPGYPYVLNRPKGASGREYLFKVYKQEGEKKYYKMGEELQRDVDKIISEMRCGNMIGNYFVDWLKDERRTFDRLGKTRFFNIHNVAWLIVVKKYYGMFGAIYMALQEKVCSSLGMDPHGTDVMRLFVYLTEIDDNNFIANDISAWDANYAALLYYEVLYIINLVSLHFVNDLEYVEMQFKVGESGIVRIHIFGNVVYVVTSGMSSGFWGTALFNTQGHNILQGVIWLEETVEKNIEMQSLDFKMEHVREVCTGDDLGGSVSNLVKEFYNDEVIARNYARYGIKCTPPSKDGQDLGKTHDLNSFQYLKRHFRRLDDSDLSVFPLDLQVIKEMVNWRHIDGDKDELMLDICEASVRESFYHGRETFDEIKFKINQELRKMNLNTVTLMYDELKEEYIGKYSRYA